MKISVANTKVQLIQTLEQILKDWKELGHIKSLINYCNNSTEFPYSQLRKMEKMGLIRSLSQSKRNKTYEWTGEPNPYLEHIAQQIINYTGEQEKQNFKRLGTMELNDQQVRSGIIGFLKPDGSDKQEQIKKQAHDLTKLTVKITLILQKNGVPDDRIEPITTSILSLLE